LCKRCSVYCKTICSASVYIGLGNPYEIAILFEYAANASITGKGFTWMVTEIDGLPMSQISNIAAGGMLGSIVISPRGGYGPTYDALKVLWQQQNPSQYPGTIWTTGTPSKYTPETFDAVTAYGLAINAASLAQANPSDYLNGDKMKQQLFGVNFVGATGQFSFDSNGNPVNPIYTIYNVKGSTFDNVGFSNNTNITITKQIMWGGGVFETPSDNKPIVAYFQSFFKKIFQNIDITQVPRGIVTLIVLLFLILIGLIVYIAYLLYRGKKNRPVCGPKKYFRNEEQHEEDKIIPQTESNSVKLEEHKEENKEI